MSPQAFGEGSRVRPAGAEASVITLAAGGDPSLGPETFVPRKGPELALGDVWAPRARLARGAGALGTALLGTACLLGRDLLNDASAGEDRSVAAPWGPLGLLSAALGGACVAASLTFALMRPPKKVGRCHHELDPNLFPRRDPRCTGMPTRFAPLAPSRQQAFGAPVPDIIHQIWLGDPEQLAGRERAWQAYAELFGYRYRLWREDDLSSLKMTADNRAIIDYELGQRDFWAAADVLRLEVLCQHGGLYVDVDFLPPRQEGRFLPLAQLMPMTNLTLVTEPFARDTGVHHGIFVCNGFLAASQGHPVMVHARDTVAENWSSFYRPRAGEAPGAPRGRGEAMYATGPFFLNRILRGAPNILMFSEIEELGMVAF